MDTSIDIARSSWPGRHAALHGLLRAQQEALREQRRSLREAPLEAVVVADDEERAAQEHEVGLDIALLEIRSRQVREIEDALRRVETGGYGLCVDCGEPIVASRLHARPFAVRCRACQEVLEGEDRGPRPTAAFAPARSPWALLGSGSGPWPWSRRGANAPRAPRIHRGTAVPVNRPPAYGGVSP
jgi:DnaK suppressor protein